MEKYSFIQKIVFIVLTIASYYFLHIRDTNVTILFLFQDITSTPFKKSTLTEKYKSPRKEKKKDVLFPLFFLRIIEEENAKNIKISS